MKGELYEYNGQKLSQAEIARLEGINRATLADWYKKTGDMASAVEGAKKSYAQRHISYHDEVLSLKAISQRENVKFESLKKYYDQTSDIYEAVNLTKESQSKRKGDILYKGQMMSALAIANMEDLDAKALRRNLKSAGDIEIAVELTKKARDLHRGTIEYKNKTMSISAIAKEEGIKHETLKKYYDLYGNIDKAIFITKKSQLKRKKALLKGKQGTYEELAKQFNLSVIELDKMISSGISIDNMKKKPKKGVKAEAQMKYDEDSLYHYCLNHSYNYWVINSLVNTYGKTPEEAIKAYKENGQQIPTKWIYQKYGVLFKHLMLNFGLDSNRVIKIMKEHNVGIEEAVTKLVFISNNNDNGFDKAEIDWLEELYSYVKDLPGKEYEEAKQTFYVTDREEQFLIEKSKKINNINRQLLLFEFSDIVDLWPADELSEMMDLYHISDKEKLSIVLDLYSPFDNKVIDPKNDDTNNRIKEIVMDSSITDDMVSCDISLSKDEKSEIIRKRELISKIVLQNTNTNKKENSGNIK